MSSTVQSAIKKDYCGDLGVLVPEVNELLEENNYPGMKVLEFAFGGAERIRRRNTQASGRTERTSGGTSGGNEQKYEKYFQKPER